MKKFPTAFTILFGLIVVVAALTWIIPAGQYERAMNETLGKRGAGARHLRPGRAEPAGARRGADGADRRALRPGDRHGERRRRGGLRADHRRLPRGGDEDRGDRRGHRLAADGAEGAGDLDDPDPDGGLRRRRHQLRHGGGEPRLLRDRAAGVHPGGLRRADRGRGDHARLRHRHARLDLQRLRDGDRLERGGGAVHRRADAAGLHPLRLPRRRHPLRRALRAAGEGGAGALGGGGAARGQHRSTSSRARRSARRCPSSTGCARSSWRSSGSPS